MSAISTRDPRVTLVREKYFSLRPKPLERWLWQQGVPPSAERVFWLHWEEGMRAGGWCSQLSLKRVAAACCLDVSSVTRAYQILTRLGLLRREDPGRDAANPFHQPTALTEVLVPRALLAELERAPNRHRRDPEARPARSESPSSPTHAAAPRPQEEEGATGAVAPQPAPKLSRETLKNLWRTASAAEASRYREALRIGGTHIAFDPDTRLAPEERAFLLHSLTQARAAPPPTALRAPAHARLPASSPGPRRLSLLEAARLRRTLQQRLGLDASHELLHQVLWSVEEGALRRFEPAHALNIALKKIREGAWTRPHRMPPHWLRAAPETCSAA